MKRINNWESIKEASSYENVKAGGYICRIARAIDVPDKEYLEIWLDIADGQFTDYYDNLYQNRNFWGLKMYRSYKETSLGFFKSFISTVEKSNAGYSWNWDELTLNNKLIGVVLQEEEYEYNDNIKTRLKVQETKTVSDIRNGNYKVKDKITVNKPKADNNLDLNLDVVNNEDGIEDNLQFD